ncbi:MAG: histidine phosphatase family protein [Paracoccaceae bacterium]
MPVFPEIFVLRHGQTEWNMIGRHQGRLDSPLTDLGRAQAVAQSRILVAAIGNCKDITAYCSPQGRATDTASIALEPLGLAAIPDDRLCEISFGKWQGLTFDEIASAWPQLVSDADHDPFGWQFQAPGGEAFEDISARALGFLEDLTSPSIIVTHGITSRIMRAIWLGQGIDAMVEMPGGQGCVHHLSNAGQRTLYGPDKPGM